MNKRKRKKALKKRNAGYTFSLIQQVSPEYDLWKRLDEMQRKWYQLLCVPACDQKHFETFSGDLGG